ncbi:MAG: ArsR/SmtB family transcription factor [Gemmatimonadota bacterium]
MEANLARDPDLAVIEADDAVSALANPQRRCILQALAAVPDSASGLAERLDDTRQRMNYHVRQLEAAGLVELAEERPRRGLTERIFRPVSRRFALDPSILGPLDAGESIGEGDRWAAAYAISLASRTIREVAALRAKAASREKRLAIASMDTTIRLRSPRAMEAFIDDLARTITEVVARHDDPGSDGRPFRVTSCSHPAPDDPRADKPDPMEE